MLHRRRLIGFGQLVLDAGQIAVSVYIARMRICAHLAQEFDTPTKLYTVDNGIFRGMCDRSSISWDDIRYASKAREAGI